MLGYMPCGSEFYFEVPEYYKETLVKEKKENVGWVKKNNQILGRVGNSCWFTNLNKIDWDNNIKLTKKYNEIDYPKYDTYNAINVGNIKEVPYDYNGIIGCPITIVHKIMNDGYIHLDKYIYKIIGTIGASNPYNVGKPIINGKSVYKRILIQKETI